MTGNRGIRENRKKRRTERRKKRDRIKRKYFPIAANVNLLRRCTRSQFLDNVENLYTPGVGITLRL